MGQASAHCRRLAAWGREVFDAPPLQRTITRAAGQLQTVTASAFVARWQGSGAIAVQKQWAKGAAQGQNLLGGQGWEGVQSPKSNGGSLYLQGMADCNGDAPGPVSIGGGSPHSSQINHEELCFHEASGSGAGTPFGPTSRVSPLLRSAVLLRAPQGGQVYPRQSFSPPRWRGISGNYRSWEWRSYSVQAVEPTWEAESSAMLRVRHLTKYSPVHLVHVLVQHLENLQMPVAYAA